MQEIFTIMGKRIPVDAFWECLPAAMALVDREGRLVYLNSMMAAFVNIDKDLLIGRKIAEFSAEGGRNVTRDYRRFDAGEDVPEHNVRIDDKLYHVAVRPLRDDSGFAIGLLFTMCELDKLNEHRRTINISNEELRMLLDTPLEPMSISIV